jgi:hypothetical protein
VYIYKRRRKEFMDTNRLDKLKKSENGRRGFKEVSHLL